MLTSSRSLAATLALSAAILGGTGLRTTTFAENKAQKAESASDSAMQDELKKILNAMLDKNGPDGIVSQIGTSDRDRVGGALKKVGDDEYAKHIKSLNDYFEKQFDGRKLDAASRIEVITNASNINKFEYEGKQFVSVAIPAGEYGPEAELRFQKNGDNYRLQLDNNVTGDELATRIKRALAKADSGKEKYAKQEHAYEQMVGSLLLSTLDYDAQHTRAAERNKK